MRATARECGRQRVNILEYLNRGETIVMAATHDIELLGLLVHRYESHYFREIIHNQQVDFTIEFSPEPRRHGTLRDSKAAWLARRSDSNPDITESL